MENNLNYIAIITNPRSGTRSAADIYAERYGKQTIGINNSTYAPSTCAELSEVKSGDFIVCGHWYSLHQIDPRIVSFIDEHYHVITIERPGLHRLVSALLVMQTGMLDPNYDEIEISENLVDDYIDTMKHVNQNKKLIHTDITLEFDDIFGAGESEKHFNLRTKQIVNSKQLIERYLRSV